MGEENLQVAKCLPFSFLDEGYRERESEEGLERGERKRWKEREGGVKSACKLKQVHEKNM